MPYDFDHVVQRTGTYSLKWDDHGFFEAMVPGIRQDQDTIRLELADMDFRCAPAIVKAMHRVADFGNYGYTTADSAPEFKTAIIDWYKRRYGFTIKPEWIVYASGALDGVEQTIRSCSDPGDGVIICRPVYSNFTSSVMGTGRKVVNCQMINGGNGDYRMDWDALAAACAEPANKVMILCSPQNPVGRVWSKEELCRLAELCRKNGVVLVSDEIHSDFVRKWEKHLPILTAVEDHSNLVMVSGVNKSFNLQGLHASYSVISDDALRERFTRNYATTWPTPFALAGTIAAYNESEDWLDELNTYLDELITMAVDRIRLKLPKAKVYVPQATYILWVDFSDYGYGPDLLQELVNQRADVLVQSGLAHDPEQGAYILRICLTTCKEKVMTAIDRIADAFAAYEAENKQYK